MITPHAFGNQANKEALKTDVRTKGPVYAAWLTSASIEGDLAPIARDYGLHPALVRLLPAMGAFGEDDQALAFYDALLDAIPIGAETGNLARRAVVLAWTDPIYGRAELVEAGAVRQACEDIISLVRQSFDNAIDKSTWRAARTRLTKAQRDTAADEAVVDLMLSLAWDLEISPGAVQDVMRSWSAQLSTEADSTDEDVFNPDEAVFFKSSMDRINSETYAAFDVDGAADFSYADFLAEVNKRWAADPVTQDLKTRSVARQGRVKVKLASWRSSLQQKMLADATELRM